MKFSGCIILENAEAKDNEDSCSLKCIVHVCPLSGVHKLKRVKSGFLWQPCTNGQYLSPSQTEPKWNTNIPHLMSALILVANKEKQLNLE